MPRPGAVSVHRPDAVSVPIAISSAILSPKGSEITISVSGNLALGRSVVLIKSVALGCNLHSGSEFALSITHVIAMPGTRTMKYSVDNSRCTPFFNHFFTRSYRKGPLLLSHLVIHCGSDALVPTSLDTIVLTSLRHRLNLFKVPAGGAQWAVGNVAELVAG